MTTLTGRTRLKAEPNVTPMIDVLLVLLVIFMIVTPKRSRGLNASVPQQATKQEASAPADDIVLSVLSDKTVMLNQEAVALKDLDARLRQLFAAAPNHALFIRGDKNLDFQEVAQVIDVAKGAGLNRIGLMTK